MAGRVPHRLLSRHRLGQVARARRLRIALIVMFLVPPGTAAAQDLEPGTYVNAPVGANALVLGVGRTRGEVVFDPTLPVEGRSGAHQRHHGRVRAGPLDIADRSARLELFAPYTWGSAEGLFLGEFTRITRAGLADPRIRFAYNLYRAPALEAREFASYRQDTIVGVSLQVVVPLGQYDDTKRINLGSNRWAFRPEIGLSQAWGPWRIDLHASVWLSTGNTRYLETSTRHCCSTNR